MLLCSYAPVLLWSEGHRRMTETAQQYIARILKHSEGLDGLAVLAETPGRLKALVDTTPRERWLARPEPGRWSAGEVLAHLADE